MYKEAPPFIEPDLTNLHRLYREGRRRTTVEKQYPDMAGRLAHIFEQAAVKSYLQALPQQGINMREEEPGIINPGVIPRGIEITNSIISRKIFIKRLVEAVLGNDQDSRTDIAAIKREMEDFSAYLGLPAEMAALAAHMAEQEAGKTRTAGSLRVITGGLAP